MNQSGYFGQYQGGFKTVPDNAYQMMTAPTKEITGAINNAVGTVAGSYLKRKEQQAGTDAFQQGAAAQFKGMESMSKATGVPMNPELANQFMNMQSMQTPQQQAAFQQSLAMEAQRMQNLYNIGLQQRQAQQSQYGSQIDYLIAGRNQPSIQSSSIGNTGASIPPAQTQYSMPSYPSPYDNYGSLMPRVGTIGR